MQVLNRKEYEDWKVKNSDGYGAACFRYAEAWAELMGAKPGDLLLVLAGDTAPTQKALSELRSNSIDSLVPKVFQWS